MSFFRWSLLLLLLQVACSDGVATGDSIPASGQVELESVNYDQWQTRLSSFEKDIIVVDLWATWCIPCIERFPRMVELHRQYSGQGVQFLSLSLDDRTDRAAIERAREFLKEQQATFPNFLLDEKVTDSFEKLDLLGIPAVFIYYQGNLEYRLTGDDPRKQFTEEDVEKAIQELLERSGEKTARVPAHPEPVHLSSVS